MDGWFNTIIGQHQISHKDIAAKLSWSGYGWLLLRMNVQHIMRWICMDLNYRMRLYQIPMYAGAKLLALEIDIDDNDNVKVRRCVKDESACVFEVLIAEWRGNIRIENLTAKFLLFRSWLSMGYVKAKYHNSGYSFGIDQTFVRRMVCQQTWVIWDSIGYEHFPVIEGCDMEYPSYNGCVFWRVSSYWNFRS